MAYFENVTIKDTDNNTITPAKDESLTLLRSIFKLLKPLGFVTGSGSNRLNVDVNNIVAGTVTTVSTVTTVTTVTTVSGVTNMSNIGGVNSFDLMKAMSRTAYNTGIRSKLS